MSAQQSINEIQQMLIKAGARKLMMDYDDGGNPVNISFMLEVKGVPLPIRLPARLQKVGLIIYDKAFNDLSPTQLLQVHTTGWANIRDWIEAQLALLQTEMVEIQEIFLPYIVQRGGKTVFEHMDSVGYLLPETT